MTKNLDYWSKGKLNLKIWWVHRTPYLQCPFLGLHCVPLVVSCFPDFMSPAALCRCLSVWRSTHCFQTFWTGFGKKMLHCGWEHPRVCFDLHLIAVGTKYRGAWQLSILGGYDVSLAQAVGVRDITTAWSLVVRAAEAGVIRGCGPVCCWPWLVSPACTTALEPALSPCSHTSACLAPGLFMHTQQHQSVSPSWASTNPCTMQAAEAKHVHTINSSINATCPGPLPLNPEVPLRTPWPLQPLLPDFMYPSITSVTNNKLVPSSECLSLFFCLLWF